MEGDRNDQMEGAQDDEMEGARNDETEGGRHVGADGAPYDDGLKARRLPLIPKLAFTLFMIVHVPIDWRAWGPTNSLWVCEVALKVQLLALWLESPLLTSVALVGTLLIQLVWIFDFACGLLLGFTPLNQAGYMFSGMHPAVLGLSLYHAWVPLSLLWMVKRLGYDRRAWLVTTLASAPLFVVSSIVDNDPGGGNGNLNFVFGPDYLPGFVWLTVLWLTYAVVVTLPAHLVLCRFMPPAPEA